MVLVGGWSRLGIILSPRRAPCSNEARLVNRKGSRFGCPAGGNQREAQTWTLGLCGNIEIGATGTGATKRTRKDLCGSQTVSLKSVRSLKNFVESNIILTSDLLHSNICNRSGDNVEKQLLRYGNIQVSILIFVLYYGVPMFTIETGVDKNLDDLQDPGLFFKRALFPVTYVGMGQKISKWGIGDAAEASVGALMILWSAQATVGKLFDAIDAYYL